MKFIFILFTSLGLTPGGTVDTSTTSSTTITYTGLQCQSENPKILVAGGGTIQNRHELKDVLDVELIDLCSNEIAMTKPLPKGKIFAFGFFAMDSAIICGGSSAWEDTSNGRNKRKVSDNCLRLSESNSHWNNSLRLSNPISGPSFVQLNDTWNWKLGGSDSDGKYLKTTEFIHWSAQNGLITKPGPDLPRENSLFSSVKINETTLMIIGGVGYSNKKNTFFYNLVSEKWSPGPQLNEARMAATAGLLVDHKTNETVLVVVGGRGVRLDSIEVLRFQQPEPTWILLSNLPFPIMSHSMVEFGNDLIVIGGYGRFEDDGQDGASPYILRLFCIDGSCEWETLPQKLKFPRFDAIAVKTPYDFLL